MTLVWTAERELDAGLWRRLPEWKVKKLLAHRDGKARRQSLLAWALLDAALGPGLPSVEQGPLGKPWLPGGPGFSLSHCPGLAVLALAEADVGVDVEPPDALNDPAQVRLWTVRESYGKSLGTGPAAPPTSAALWTGTLPGGFVVSVCTQCGAAAPIRITEWDGGPIWPTD